MMYSTQFDENALHGQENSGGAGDRAGDSRALERKTKTRTRAYEKPIDQVEEILKFHYV